MNKSLLRQAFFNRKALIGKQVIYNGPDHDRIKKGDSFTIKDVLLANHSCYLRLKELPDKLCFLFSSRTEGPGNVFNAKYFDWSDS